MTAGNVVPVIAMASAVMLFVAAVVFYYFGKAMGRLAEQENLSWKLKHLDGDLRDADDLKSTLEDRIDELNAKLEDTGGDGE